MRRLLMKGTVFFVVVILVATNSFAQKFHLALNYNTATPLSSGFKDYVSKTSFRGFQGSILYNLDQQFRVGLQASYNDFYEKFPRQVYKTTNGADISTVLTNTMQVTPVLVKGEYSPVKDAWIQPYVGLGAGVNFVNFSQFYGEFEYNKFSTKAAFSGDVGVLIPFSKAGHYGARLSTSYNFSPFNEGGIKHIDSWNIQAGVVVPLK